MTYRKIFQILEKPADDYCTNQYLKIWLLNPIYNVIKQNTKNLAFLFSGNIIKKKTLIKFNNQQA